MVGVWFPTYLQQINVPGFHFHFIDEARQIGGHVFNFKIVSAMVEIQTMHSLQLDLIENDLFYKADLNNQDESGVATVEQQHE
jgi:acetolactate decarboxylase